MYECLRYLFQKMAIQVRGVCTKWYTKLVFKKIIHHLFIFYDKERRNCKNVAPTPQGRWGSGCFQISQEKKTLQKYEYVKNEAEGPNISFCQLKREGGI